MDSEGPEQTVQNCRSAQSDEGLHCLLIALLSTTECMNGEKRPR